MTSKAPAKTAPQATGQPAKAKVFISYSRKDMAFVDRLEVALKTRGFSAAIDRSEIYAFEEWWKRIETLITQADTVVFVLSPDSVASQIALKEVAFAASLNKRLAPIVCRRVNDKALPEALAKFNFIFFDDEARFEESAHRLAQALNTDIAWIRSHTEFGEEARQWSLASRPNGLLLRSPALEEAEHWIATRPEGAPVPTEETQAFILHSRRTATRRRTVLTGSLTAGLILALAVLGLAYWGFQTAERNFKTAERNFGVARETADYMIKSTAEGLREVQGINVKTIDIVLGAVNRTINMLTESYPDSPLIDLTRASVGFEFAKTYQRIGNRTAAWKRATESLEIRSTITKYDQRESSPQAFEAGLGDLGWQLSESLELVGDLQREESKEKYITDEERKRLRQEAFRWFRQALAVRRRLAETSPDKDEWVIGISKSLTRLGDLSGEEGDAEMAQGYYKQSLDNAGLLFRRRRESAEVRRELSWNFNKIGDSKMAHAARKARNKEPFRELTEAALVDFNNSLCIRRILSNEKPQDLKLKRDVSYTLAKIGGVRLLLDEPSGAEAAYFEALAIRLDLLHNDDRDAFYVEDVVGSLKAIGDLYRLYRAAEPERALAFYEYAADLRKKPVQRPMNEREAQAAENRLREIQESIEDVQSKLDPETRAVLTGRWWSDRVKETVDSFKTQVSLETNPEACLDVLMASVEESVGAGTTTAFQQKIGS